VQKGLDERTIYMLFFAQGDTMKNILFCVILGLALIAAGIAFPKIGAAVTDFVDSFIEAASTPAPI